MKFNHGPYNELLFNKKIEEAKQYRRENVPKVIYKFFSLNEIKCGELSKECVETKILNDIKLKTIENKHLWLSKFKYLNDPFEHKAMILDESKLNSGGWEIKFIKTILDNIRDSYVISSFTTNLLNNMPMWAHYSNNHKGFCIEYEVVKPEFLYAVSYEKDKFSINVIFTKFLTIINKLRQGKISEDDNELAFLTEIVHHFGLSKHISWEYENEYRILFPYKNCTNGVTLPINQLGLSIKNIYIGINCNESHKKNLIEIAMKLNIDVYELVINEFNPSFELESKLVYKSRG